MNKYHVCCGLAGIYAGTLKNENEWKEKSDCTDESINAVRDYMVSELLGGISCSNGNTGSYEWKLKDGRTVELRITISNG